MALSWSRNRAVLAKKQCRKWRYGQNVRWMMVIGKRPGLLKRVRSGQAAKRRQRPGVLMRAVLPKTGAAQVKKWRCSRQELAVAVGLDVGHGESAYPEQAKVCAAVAIVWESCPDQRQGISVQDHA
jgi:hypothetical protein